MAEADGRSPLISIIIVTFNAAEYLPRTLRSIAEQSDESRSCVEILLMDGNSTDDTLRIARESGLLSSIQSEADNGIYDAMNKGARSARGTWLHFLNAGDAFTTGQSLQCVVDSLRGSSGSAWAISSAQNMLAGAGTPVTIPSVPHSWVRHAFGLQPHCHQACWFHRTTFLQSDGFSLHYGTASDFDSILRFGLLAPPSEIEGVHIDYLGGGISERGRREIPRLLHRIRVDRFDLGKIGSALDLGMSRAVAGINATRRIGGGVRRSLLGRSTRRRRIL